MDGAIKLIIYNVSLHTQLFIIRRRFSLYTNELKFLYEKNN